MVAFQKSTYFKMKLISISAFSFFFAFSDTCTKHPVFENIVSECNGPYSWGNEDTEQYSAGWKPPLNASETRKLRHRKRKALWLGLENAWQHQSVLKLKNFPFLGKFGTYSGSSYAVSIGPDERISRLILKCMCSTSLLLLMSVIFVSWMSRHIVSLHLMSCHTKTLLSISCTYFRLYHVISCHVISCHVISCLVIP